MGMKTNYLTDVARPSSASEAEARSTTRRLRCSPRFFRYRGPRWSQLGILTSPIAAP